MKKYKLLLFILFMQSSIYSQSKKLPFDVEGHRGCRGLMPENTIAAMLKAIDLGVTTLEMDVVISKDSQVIVSHDAFFDHEITTLPDGSYLTESDEKDWNIYKMTYAEISRIDVGMKAHPRFPLQKKMKAVKPLLATLIDSVESYCKLHSLPFVQYNIEIKSLPITDNIYHPTPPEFAERLIDILQSKKIENRVIIQSFDTRPLQYIHKNHSSFPISLLIESFDKKNLQEQLNRLGFIPNIYSPDFNLVNDALIKSCHDLNIKVIPWTVNTLTDIQNLQAMGVDGIITDYPDLLQKQLSPE